MILGLPIPQIILAEDKQRRGKFIVIDGKQRLIAIRQFTADPTDADFQPLYLTGLKDRPELNGLSYTRLQSRDDLYADLNSFDNQSVRTVIIRNWDDEQYLWSVFLRINTGSVQLSPQELRQALRPGPFTDYVDDFALDSSQLRKTLKLKGPDFRMRDTELALRYFAYKNFAPLYSGDLKKFLDDTTSALNRDWETKKDVVEKQALSLERSLAATEEIFGDGQMKKWNGNRFEPRFNRAIFDIMTYYFSEEHIREAAVRKGQSITSKFKSLCADSPEFMRSLESTTKSLDANRIRFATWAQVLASTLSLGINSPF